jgi:hypothetical protein
VELLALTVSPEVFAVLPVEQAQAQLQQVFGHPVV